MYEYTTVDEYLVIRVVVFFFFSSRRRHTRFDCDWSSDVCSSDLTGRARRPRGRGRGNRAARWLGARPPQAPGLARLAGARDRKSTRLNSSHSQISYAVFCLKKKNDPGTASGLAADALTQSSVIGT